jgi:heavy metal translocating P-type ATPase
LILGESQRQESQPNVPPGMRFDGFAVRIGIGLLVAGQSMIFGLAINLEEKTPAAVRLGVQGFILAGTLLVIALLGPQLVRNAFAEFRNGRLTIEALFLLTLAGAMAASLQSFFSGRGPIYFEVVSVLLVVYAFGKAIGARSRAAAIASVERWSSSLRHCRIVDDRGCEQTIEVTKVSPGDVVTVHPGETFAVDGVIVEGLGFVSEAAVNGEPFSVVRRPGDQVFAGMIAIDAGFRVEAQTSGTSRQIDRLLQTVEKARNRPSTMQSQADKLARVFLPLTMLAAVATFVVWWLLSGWQAGLFNAMSVLLVTCPCALGLATPIILWSTLNRLAERGIVANAGDIVERLSQIDCVIFDKTGTLTENQFAIVEIATAASGDDRDFVLGCVSLVEANSKHPLARPFANLPRRFRNYPKVTSVRAVPGCGIEAILEGANAEFSKRVCIGRPEWIGATGSAEEREILAEMHAKTGHRIDFSFDGRLAGVAIVNERLRDSAPETLAALKKMRLPVQVFTGDRSERAVELSLSDVNGSMLPDDKRQRVEAMKSQGYKPLMIGDGINDASALAVAHAGIALSSGTDLANGAATATLYHGDLRVIPWAIAVSREATQAVHRNLLCAAGYNLIGMTLAAFGCLHPVAAALLMVASSLWVAWSSVRAGSFVPLGHCDNGVDIPLKTSISRAVSRLAAIHSLAFILQGICVLLLLSLTPLTASIVIGSGVILGIATCFLWVRWSSIPHWLDMTYGMLSLGNLGMLLGWWADNHFTRLHDWGCCECVNALREGIMKPSMWIGMLLFANISMIFLGRRPHRELPFCLTSMLTGGNGGMVAGMILGGILTGNIEAQTVPVGMLLSFLGMTIGMVAGMLLGTELTRLFVGLLLRLRHVPYMATDDYANKRHKIEGQT